MPSSSTVPPTECSPSFQEDFLVKRLVGQGSFAKVYKCIDISSGNVVAVKEIRPPTHHLEEEQVQNEIEICRTLCHVNIVTLHRAFVGAEGPRYLVMDFVNGESLFDEIIRQTVYSEKQAGSIIKQVKQNTIYVLRYNSMTI